MIKIIQTFKVVERNYVDANATDYEPVGTSLDIKSVMDYVEKWSDVKKRSNGDRLEIQVVYKKALDV